ncbi:MAG: pre-peptidase C-terminal domain-containing protein, partial [Rhodothermia bacterium]
MDVDIWPFATTPASDPGNDFASAVVIDPFVGLQTFRENVGALDADDYYKFTLDAAATVTAQISELNEDLDVAIVADINGNGVHDSNETLEFTSGGGKGRQRVVEELAPGTYFFWVFQRTFGEALNSHYRLDVDIAAIGSLQVDDPGETLVTATDLGALGSSLTVSDIVGALDVSDFYRFTIGTAQTVQVLLRGLAEDLQLQLIDDANGNGIIDNGEDLAASRRSRNSSESMVASLQAGTYFVRVYQDNFAESENSSYELSIRTPTAATANPSDPGGNLPSAANLGTLNGAVARSDFVGDSDADDFYRIRLDEPREVRVLLSGLAEDADVRLIADVDGNLAIASGEVIESSNSSGSDHDFISEDLGPGDYFVHVFQPSFPANQNTNYNLEITSTPLAISTASDPGELLPAAMDIGNLTTPQVFQGYIGSLDTQDLYRFTMQTQGEVRATLGGLVEDATLSIVADVNANLAIDSGEVIESITSSSNGLVVLTETLPPGDYFLRVVQDTFPVGENSRYQLEAEAVGAPRNTIADPGETLPAALDLGTLQLGTLVAKQTLRESVGDLDRTDLYRFQLDEIAEIRINAEGLQEDAIISLIADVNGNFAIDSGESIESVTTSQGNPALLDETLPPGVYYLRVEQDTFPVGENTAYDIALEALPAIRSSIRDPGETILDALDIDVLGEPSISDAVGNLDLADIYRFALAQTTEVSVDLAGLSEDIIVEVIADANNDNVIAAAEVTEQATSSEGELQLTETLGPGTYFLRIRPDT